MKGKIIATYRDGTKHELPLSVPFDRMVAIDMEIFKSTIEVAKEHVLNELREGSMSLVRYSERMSSVFVLSELKPIVPRSKWQAEDWYEWRFAKKEVIHE